MSEASPSNRRGSAAEQLYDEALKEQPLQALEQFCAGPATLAELPKVPKPYFLDLSLKEKLIQATLTLGGALKSLTQRVLAGEYKDYLIQDPALAEATACDAEKFDPQCFWRFDYSYSPETDQLKVMECNAGDPSGQGFTDLLAEQFLTLAPLKRVQERYRLSWDSLMQSHQATVTERFGIKAGEGAVYFLIPPESTVYQDQLSMSLIYQRNGWDAPVRDPRDFQWKDGRLHSDLGPVDYIVRDTLDELVLEPYRQGAQPILDAYQAGAVQIINPFCSAIADHKSLLALLPQLYPEVEPWIPETHLVTGISSVRSRQQWVLKPSFGWGGEEVLVGRDCTDQEWERAYQQATEQAGKFIEQRYSSLPEMEFPHYDGERYLGYASRHLTLSCWIHNGRFAGCFARAGAQRVVNVNQGGSLMPVFFVDD